MAVAENQDLREYCETVASNARAASAELALATGAQKNRWLTQSAQRLRESEAELQTANAKDLQAAESYGLTSAQTDRLRLTPERIEGIAAGLEQVAMFPDPVGQIIDSSIRPNGLQVSKVRVPLGVVFFIYESRPNVTADAAAICLKSGNAVILRGGKEAAHSSRAIVDLLVQVATANQLPAHAVQLVATTNRQAVGHFLALHEQIDVAIPRGGEGLIRRVASEATMPVIKHFAGNCHVYVDCDADLEMALRLVINSKCQRMGVCNTCESVLVHADVAAEFLPRLGQALDEHSVTIRGDARTVELIPGAEQASEQDYFTEYLAPVLSVKTVSSSDEAIRHINHYGSHHTDAIVTRNITAAREFERRVDSSAVMINASTRFNDGFEFGLGAEIGISTDKFHARGPCGLSELTSYKYVCYGEGHEKQ